MKMFSFKKVTAAVSTMALVASMGVSAFAAGNISIGEIKYDVTNSTNGVHVFKVPYTVTGEQNIGITMLSYMANTGNIANDSTTYDDSTMSVIGIDQNGTEESGTFVLKVSAEGATANKIGLVRLGGDNVSDTVAKKIATPGLALSTTAIGEITKAQAGDNVDAKFKEAIAEAVVSDGVDLHATYFGAADEDGLATLTIDEDVAAVSDIAVSDVTATSAKITYKGQTANVTFTTANEVVTTTQATATANVTSEDLSGVEGATTEEKVKAALAGKTITLKGTSSITGAEASDTFTLSASMIGDVTASGDNYTATVTIPAGTVGTGSKVKAGDSDLAVTLTISVGASYTLGDVNNDGLIDGDDYAMIKRYAIGKITQFEDVSGNVVPVEAGNVNGDTLIDGDDYAMVKRYAIGKITSFE